MKTITNLRNIAILIPLFLFAIGTFGQNTIRQNRRNANLEKERNVTEPEKQDNHLMQSRRDYTMRSPHKINNRGVGERNGHYRDKEHKNNNGNDRNDRYNNHYKEYNHSHPNYQMHVKKSRHPHSAYYRRLPYQRINRFHFRGVDYFHADNRFYMFQPGFGYYQVDVPFIYVRQLPPRVFVRYVNGNGYYFAKGMIYLPYENGFLVVPQPERPMFSLNIVLN